MTEYLIILGVVAIAAIAFVPVLIAKPSLLSNAVVIGVFGFLVSLVAWTAKKAMSALVSTAELLILEELSKGGQMNRAEIRRLLDTSWGLIPRCAYRCFPTLIVDALTILTIDKELIVLKNGQYRMKR